MLWDRFGGVRISALVWYRREDYRRIRQIMADGGSLPPRFDEWEKRAKQMESSLNARGIQTIRVELHPDQFVSWCRLHGRPLDVEARHQFASETAVRGTAH